MKSVPFILLWMVGLRSLGGAPANSEILARIEAAEQEASRGNRPTAEAGLAAALRDGRQLPDASPLLTARAAFSLGHCLEGDGKSNAAMLFFNYSIPQLISQTGLSNEVANLHFPSEDLWPANEPLLDRREWLKKLDAAAPPVDFAAEFPALALDAEGFPVDSGDLANVSAQLDQMLPNLLTVAKRPSPAELEAGINQYLAAMK